jgi:hypothetical protein
MRLCSKMIPPPKALDPSVLRGIQRNQEKSRNILESRQKNIEISRNK